MIRRLARYLALWMLLLAFLPAFAGERLVLIASADSDIDQLDSAEVRKLFLGMTVAHNGSRVKPLLNDSEARIKELFLQNVVSMTDTMFDRRVLRLAMAGEANVPSSYSSTKDLLDAVAHNRLAVSYAWANEVEHDKRIKILRTLWHD